MRTVGPSKKSKAWASQVAIPFHGGCPPDGGFESRWLLGRTQHGRDDRQFSRASTVKLEAKAALASTDRRGLLVCKHREWISSCIGRFAAPSESRSGNLPVLGSIVVGKLALPQWQLDLEKWLAHGFAFMPLLMAVVFQWRGAMKVGLAMFSVAVLLHTFSVGLRQGEWSLAQSNTFEAVTTAAWFGAFSPAFEISYAPPAGVIVALGAGRNGGIDVAYATVSRPHDFQ